MTAKMSSRNPFSNQVNSLIKTILNTRTGLAWS